MKRLLTPGSIPALAMRCSDLGKDILRIFPNETIEVYPLWWSRLIKGLQTE